jgi:hypothetical protein
MQYKPAETSKFRSHLEARVASELDRHFVRYAYESREGLPDLSQLRYLPDFRVISAPLKLSLPVWIECKPQQFLYDLRDELDVTRKFGEYFCEPVSVESCGSVDLYRMGANLSELAKPKRLAELTGLDVLLVGGAGAKSRLSVLLKKSSIVFDRQHPFVNWRGYSERIERERRETEARACAEEARQAYEKQKAEAEARAYKEKRQLIELVKAAPHKMANRYAGECVSCGCDVLSGLGSLRAIFDASGNRFHRILCGECCDYD